MSAVCFLSIFTICSLINIHQASPSFDREEFYTMNDYYYMKESDPYPIDGLCCDDEDIFCECCE